MKTITILMLSLAVAACMDLEMQPAHNWQTANQHEHVNDSLPMHGDQAYVEMYPDGCGI